MNNQMLQTISQLKGMPNLKNQAIQCLQNASRQGNVMAQGLLKDIESGNMSSAENTLTNYMSSQGTDIKTIMNMFK